MGYNTKRMSNVNITFMGGKPTQFLYLYASSKVYNI